MAERIPQSIAKRCVFRAYLASDGKTPATGKTIAITISVNGAAFANPAIGALNATQIGSGFYYFDLGTADAGTLGPLAWRGAEATINDAGDIYEVANPHNAGFDGIANAAAGAAGGVALVGSNMGTVTSCTTVGTVTNPVTLAANQHVIVDSGTVTSCTTVGTVTNPVTLAAGQHVIVDSGTVTSCTTVATVTNPVTLAGDFTAIMKTSLNAATPTVTLAAGQHVIVDSGSITSCTVVGTVTNPVTLAAGQHVIVDSGAITTCATVGSVTNPVAVGTNSDKDGYALSAAGLDQIPSGDPGPAALINTFPKKLIWLYRRFFNRAVMTAAHVQTFDDAGTTANVTQNVSDDGTTQIQGAGQ